MVYLFLAEGFETVEAFAPYDLMKRAGIDVKSVSIKKDKRVVSSQGIAVEADLSVTAVKNADPELVMLPGRDAGRGQSRKIRGGARVPLPHLRVGRLAGRDMRRAVCAGCKRLSERQRSDLLPRVSRISLSAQSFRTSASCVTARSLPLREWACLWISDLR